MCMYNVYIYNRVERVLGMLWRTEQENKISETSGRTDLFLDFPCQTNTLLLPSLVIASVLNIYYTVIHCITKHKVFDCYKHHCLISSSASLLEFLSKPPGSTPWTWITTVVCFFLITTVVYELLLEKYSDHICRKNLHTWVFLAGNNKQTHQPG